ncbi:MAG: fimbrial protein [Lysobacterales bacterium CG02_land_8_20_14_3_00_62_12]|nr:MAG: fimbrial protein [Xanthomonadales bacterium CG02_land_8_20_14_3_00_62_12]
MASFDLSKLDRNNYGSWPMPVKFAAALLLLLLLVALGWWMMIKPKQNEFAAAKAQEATLMASFAEKQGKVVNLDEYKQQLADIEDLLRQMVRQLPSKTEMPDLLVDISQTALSAGIDNELFEPGAESPHQFYAERPIQLRMVGTYHQFGAFVSGVAALPRVVILTMHDVSLKPLASAQPVKGQRAAPTGQLVLEGTVKTYRALDDNEIEETATPAKPGAASASPAAAAE